MNTEIEAVAQEIRKVEQQIDDVKGQLTKAATEADVAYWRKEEDQLWTEQWQLREVKLLLLKADIAGEKARVVYMDGKDGPKLVLYGRDGRTDVCVPMSVADIFV